MKAALIGKGGGSAGYQVDVGLGGALTNAVDSHCGGIDVSPSSSVAMLGLDRLCDSWFIAVVNWPRICSFMATTKLGLRSTMRHVTSSG